MSLSFASRQHRHASRPAQLWQIFGRALSWCVGLGGLGLGAASCGTEDIELLPPARVITSEPTPPPGDVALFGPSIETDPQSTPGGCEKVDFLFVVDNSGSMREEQDNLARSFPGFIEVVQRTLRARDYHIMVVDTDASGGAAGLTGLENGDISCQPAPACCRLACAISLIPVVGTRVVQSCNGLDCADARRDPPKTDCEGVLGAGKRLDPNGQSCGMLEPARYMLDGQSDLSRTFSCAARVGTFGNGAEQPMAALSQALSSAQNGPGDCNAGFLRDDAVVVVTFITDEDDENSPGDVLAWRQALLDAKHGNQEAVVLLGLVGDGNIPGGLPGGPCGDAAKPAPKLQEFVQGFRYGSLGSVCAPDYTPFFQQAVSAIDTACNVFQPIR
jgi:hypothetical protein